MAYPSYWAQGGSRGARGSADWYGCLAIANVRDGGSDEGSTIFQRRQTQHQCQGKQRSLRTQSLCMQSSPPAARQRFRSLVISVLRSSSRGYAPGLGGARPSGAGRAPPPAGVHDPVAPVVHPMARGPAPPRAWSRPCSASAVFGQDDCRFHGQSQGWTHVGACFTVIHGSEAPGPEARSGGPEARSMVA